MKPRITLARFLIGLGKYIQSTALMVMRPDDLVEFGRQMYARPHNVAGWAEADVVEQGLVPEEEALLALLPHKNGKLLLLGVGGGREAIPLARQGFQVTGVDFVPDMVETARQNAARQGLAIDGLVQEISKLDVPDASYDVVWLSAAMYSCIPTRARRVAMLERIRQALRPGGHFVCQFHVDARQGSHSWGERGRRLVSILTLGNLSYEPGDMLWHDVEFLHGFRSQEELRSEFAAGGFDIAYLEVGDTRTRGEALLAKR